MTYCLIKNKGNQPDYNGYGSVDHNFLIQQCFINCEEYVNFLNNIGATYKFHDLYHDKMHRIITKNRSIFTLNNNIDNQSPVTYIGLKQLKIYCNWMNTQNLKYLLDFPYDIRNNRQYLQEAVYWIPSYDEWYKATYYDPETTKYWLFPNKSNKPNDNHTLSPYGLIDAGFKYYTIISANNNDNKYMISGGSANRNPLNAKSGTVYYVSEGYYAPYISARLCKKSDTKKFVLKLYDTYGDGWGANYLDINDSCHNPLYTKITLQDGYGPTTINIEVDKIEKNINIRFHKIDNLSYENYYELYDTESDALIYRSNMYETPPENIIVPLS